MLIKSLKSAVKAVVSPIVDATGLYDRRIATSTAAKGGWTVVMYHRVVDDLALDPFSLGMCVERGRFERQIRYLKSQFNVMAVGEVMRRLDAGEPLPDRALSVTFDDGYLDNLTTALPILQALDVPFTVYVPTGGLDSGEMLWWDRAITAMACTELPGLDLGDVGLSETHDYCSLAGLARGMTVDRVLDLLWSLEYDRAIAAVVRIEQVLAARDTRRVAARRLNPEQVRELHRHGVDIGAHSVNHPNLGLSNVAVTRQEMAESRRYLENLLQQQVHGFAYPGGHMQSVTAEVARQIGFAYAMSTVTAINTPPYDRFKLCRIGMPDTGLADFRRAFSGALMRTTEISTRRF